MIELNKRDVIFGLILFLVTFFSRLYFVEVYQSHWDGPQYSIAQFRYSLEEQTPASPGYPLYIAMAAFLNFFIGDPHGALLFESVFFTALGSVIIYWLGKMVWSKQSGLIGAILYITSPVIYFFSLTAYAYGITAVVNLLFAALVYRFAVVRRGAPLTVGIAYGLLIGFRPQDIIYTWPLLFFALFSTNLKSKIIIIGAFTTTCIAWLIPLAFIAGGIDRYYALASPIGNERIPFSPLLITDRVPIMVKGAFLTLGISIIAPILYFVKIKRFSWKGKASKKQFIFFALWLVLPFIFNLLFRSDHAGYQLPYLIPVMLIISYTLSKILVWRSKTFYITLTIIALINLILFFRNRDPRFERPYVPTSFHYSEIRKNDLKMKEKVGWIRDFTDPNDTVILVGEPDYFRPVMYYFPNYLVVQLDRLVTNEIRFRDIIRTAKNYSFTEEKGNNTFFVFPKHIKRVVCFDDECKNWLKGYGQAVFLLANSSLTSFDIVEGIEYRYHRIDPK